MSSLKHNSHFAEQFAPASAPTLYINGTFDLSFNNILNDLTIIMSKGSTIINNSKASIKMDEFDIVAPNLESINLRIGESYTNISYDKCFIIGTLGVDFGEYHSY